MPEVVYFAWCAEHGLHGCRTRCYECGVEVEQVPMVALSEYQRDVIRLAQEASAGRARLRAALWAVSDAERLLSPGMRAGTAEAKAILREVLAPSTGSGDRA